MPCLTYDPPEQPNPFEPKVSKSFLSAALCAILTSLEKEYGESGLNMVLFAIDEGESGVTKHDVFKWWDEHKELDRKRKQKEKEDALRKIRSVLSTYEMEILGITNLAR